ncbi:MAG: hypothetical protein FWF76_02910 [Oscillospiraceae bacterium]|nr:hypothetical protein [Oscillospiraceae bacterium]
MTQQEFKSYARGIANSTLKLERKEITPEQHALDMRVLLGEDVFEEAQEIINKHKTNTKKQ